MTSMVLGLDIAYFYKQCVLIQSAFEGKITMDEKFTYWASMVCGALALVLLVTNVALINSDRTLQVDVRQRQATIANGTNVNQLNQSLVQALAEAAFKNDNEEIRHLLADQGITVKESAKSGKSTDSADTKETKKK